MLGIARKLATRVGLLLGTLCALAACSDDTTDADDQALGGSSADNSGSGEAGRAGSSSMNSGAGGSAAAGSGGHNATAGAGGSHVAGSGGNDAAGAGGSTAAGADAGSTDAGTDVDGGDPSCESCIGDTISWGPNGGFVAYVDRSTLESCGRYMHERVPTGDAIDTHCMREIPCSGGLIGSTEVEQAFADPDVQAALAMQTVLYGIDSRPIDGQVFHIERSGNVIEVGGECMGTQGCSEIPDGVAALVALLHELDDQQLMLDPCNGVFDN